MPSHCASRSFQHAQPGFRAAWKTRKGPGGGGRGEEDASARPLPPSPLPSSRPGPSQEEPASEGGETENKVTADVGDVPAGGEPALTCIAPSSAPFPYSWGTLFRMAAPPAPTLRQGTLPSRDVNPWDVIMAVI